MPISFDDEDTLTRRKNAALPALKTIDWHAKTSAGSVRLENQDAWGQADHRLFALADGMGGTAGGARASALAITGFLAADFTDGWLRVLDYLNRDVRTRCDREGFPAAGTTLVAIIVEPTRCITANIGDSRIYRLRDRHLQALTTDHNLRNLRIEEGRDPSRRDERGSPRALTSYLGNPAHEQRIDIGTISAEPGDRLLLCSDGVYGQLTENRLSLLLGGGTCEDAAIALVSAADDAGGRDNATALVLEIGVDE